MTSVKRLSLHITVFLSLIRWCLDQKRTSNISALDWRHPSLGEVATSHCQSHCHHCLFKKEWRKFKTHWKSAPFTERCWSDHLLEEMFHFQWNHKLSWACVRPRTLTSGAKDHRSNQNATVSSYSVISGFLFWVFGTYNVALYPILRDSSRLSTKSWRRERPNSSNWSTQNFKNFKVNKL